MTMYWSTARYSMQLMHMPIMPVHHQHIPQILVYLFQALEMWVWVSTSPYYEENICSHCYCIVIYITFFLSSLQNKIDLSNCVDTPSTSKSTSKKIKKVIYVTKLIILYTNTHKEVYYFNSKQCQSLITCLYFCRRSETNLVLSPIYESFDVEDCLNLIIFLHFKSFPIRK